MPIALGNRVYVNTSTTGQGTLTLGGAVNASYLTLAEAGIANGAIVSYVLTQGLNVEAGLGTYLASGTTLSRDTVRFSKIAGTAGTAKINLQAGGATVMVTPHAEDVLLAKPKATADKTYYVRTDGNDSNDGSANDAAHAFLTIQHALDIAAGWDYQNLYRPFVYVANGTYSVPSAGNIALPELTNQKLGTMYNRTALLVGNAATPANVVITGNPDGFRVNGGQWLISGFKLNTASGYGILTSGTSVLFVDNVEFNSEEACVICSGDSSFTGGWDNLVLTISRATCQKVLSVSDRGWVEFGGYTWNFPAGGLALQYGFLLMNGGTAIIYENETWPNYAAVTGPKYLIQWLGRLLSCSRDYLPGDMPGTINSAGYIDEDVEYAIATPTAGQTVTTTPGQKSVILNPAGTLATLTVNMPEWASDGETFRISTSQTITALTINTTDGTTVEGEPSTLAAGQAIQFTLHVASPNNVWFIS